MLKCNQFFRFSYLVREIDANGFVGDYKRLQHVSSPQVQRKVSSVVKSDCNILFCGHCNTGKLTLLKALGNHYEQKLKKRVAYISADNGRANRLDGYLLYHFIGMRITRDELPSRDQLEGTLERHVRLVESTYGASYPSLLTVDVLLLDSIQNIHPTVLLSMEAVARRLRGKPTEPFGGLRVYGSADFWRLAVHPTSDTGGYVFQLDQWGQWFPKQELFHKTYGQDERLNSLTEKALFGTLTLKEMLELEEKSFEGKQEKNLFPFSTTIMAQSNTTKVSTSAASAQEEDDEELEDIFTSRKGSTGSAQSSNSLVTLLNDDMISNVDVITKFTSKFPKQPTIRVMPNHFRALKQVEVGNYLVNLLVQSCMPISFGLVDSLSVEVGDRVHLLLDGQDSINIPVRSVGEVVKVSEHYISVHFIEQHRTVDVPRMRIVTYHPDYPEVKYEIQQFPLFARKRLSPLTLINPGMAHKVNINGRRIADTNDLGNILAHMRDFSDFTIRNTSDIAFLDGMVHEPTRIYYHQIENKPLSSSPEQWCRNCKSFVPTETFFSHWDSCVKSVRWCPECDKAIPLEVLEPHREKHQIVLCMDCGQGVEWRQWEAHRLSCGPMMREVSVDNEFLPLRTRQLALELGLDKRDLHTMRTFSKSMLPKSRQL